MKTSRIIFAIILNIIYRIPLLSQVSTHSNDDSNTPLYLMKPNYPVPYGPAKIEEIKEVLNRILNYLDAVTPARVIDSQTKQEITDFTKPNNNAIIEPGKFRIVSYEWGVTYGAMLLAGEAAGDNKFTEYASKRIKFIADVVPYFKKTGNAFTGNELVKSVIEPQALDDAGSMCTAMIKTSLTGLNIDVRPFVDNYISFISTKQFRLPDGTLARNRPHPNTLWIDDLYMSVPALAQMGKLTGEKRYFDDAVKQILQFSQRMFVKSKGLYIHCRVEGAEDHSEFHWGRANGWALLSMSELLDVLPDEYPQRNIILEQLRAHIRGIASYQSGLGLWHQLVDRNDTYLETSASAIFTYCLAHAINKGWIDPVTYGPMTILAWNALTTKVNSVGQVEGTCVGTGMGSDPTYYYCRPTNPFAAHGYGPVILAGAETIKLIGNFPIEINESSLQFFPKNKAFEN
jgi:unsaturated rhamnogalacturonyl hydrolase